MAWLFQVFIILWHLKFVSKSWQLIELHLLLIFFHFKRFPHLSPGNHPTMTSDQLIDEQSPGRRLWLKEMQQRCSKGATCWSRNIPFWKVPVNKNVCNRLVKQVQTSITKYLQLFARCHFNMNAFNMQNTAVSPESKPWSAQTLGIQTHPSYTQEKISEINRLISGCRICLDIFAAYGLHMFIVCSCLNLYLLCNMM